MKSLKRTLSLVLALVMVLGLFGGITASAVEFTDNEDIQYKEAVDVLTGIGAIAGYPDGDEFSFQPTGLITRAEAAKIVAYTALGPEAPELLENDVPTNFTDLGDYAWAIPSIEWLVKEGAIHGRSETIYDPSSNVTGYEFLKMMLACLGYGANDEWTADKWTINALVLATKVGLIDGRNSKEALSNPAKREEAALYSFNALGTEIVVWNDLQKQYTGVGSAADNKYDPDNDCDSKTLGDDIYSLQAVAKGVVIDNQALDVNGVGQKYTVVGDTTSGATTSYNIETGADLAGHYVKVYYKSSVENLNTANEKPGVTYSVVDISNTVTVDKDINADTNGDADSTKFIKTFGAKTSDIRADYICTVDGSAVPSQVQTSGIGTSHIFGTDNWSNSATHQKAKAGTYILDEASQVVSYIADPVYKVAVVSDYKDATDKATGYIKYYLGNNVTEQELKIPKTNDTTSTTAKTFAKWRVYDGVTKGDVVIISETGTFSEMTKADSINGTVTAINTTTDKETITVDGESYGMSSAYVNTSLTQVQGIIPTAVEFDAQNSVNNECTLYLGPDGKVVLVVSNEEVTDSNLVYVIDAYVVQDSASYGQSATTYKVHIQAVDLTEGKEVDYIVGVDANSGGTISDNANGAKGVNLGGNYTQGAKAYIWKFAKVSTKLNETYGVELATVTPVTTSGDITVNSTNIGDPGSPSGKFALDAKVPALNSTKNYVNADTKFVVISDATTNGNPPASTGGAAVKPLKVTTLTGPQTASSSQTVDYYAVKADENGNSNTKYVVVLGKVDKANAANLMFVPSATLSANNIVNYTNADGKAAKAYQNLVFIDGKPTTILSDAGNGDGANASDMTDVTLGFWDYVVDTKGSDPIYSDFTTHNTKVGFGVVTNVYGGSIRMARGWNGDAHTVNVDTDASGADFIVDVPFTVDELTNGGKKELDEHATLNDLMNGKIAYTYTGSLGTDAKITGIYYMGEPSETVSIDSIEIYEVAADKGTPGSSDSPKYTANAAALGLALKTGETTTFENSTASRTAIVNNNQPTAQKYLTVKVNSNGGNLQITTTPQVGNASSGESDLTIKFTLDSESGDTFSYEITLHVNIA